MHRQGLRLFGIIAMLLLTAPRLGWSQQLSPCPEPADEPTSVLHVRGIVERALDLSAQDLLGLPRQRLQVDEHDGGVSEYEGVALADLLVHAGVAMESLRGPQVSTVVIAEARDGYRAVYALAELDQEFSDRAVVLVDRKNGEMLSDEEGPFRVIMLGERRHSRWIRQVRCLRVERL